MKKNKDNQSQVKVNKELLNAFKRYVSVYSPSGNTHKISTLVFGDLASLNPDNIFTDYYGNIHARFNCGEGATIHLNSHLDTVPRTQKNRIIKELGGIVYGYNKNQRAILGADDRAGVTAIFELLDQIVVKKTLPFKGTLLVSFFLDEEIGCVGSSKSDFEFVQQADFAITFDRRGNSDIVVGTYGVGFSNQAIVDWLDKFSIQKGYNFTCVEGGISDAYTIANDMGINSVNLSVGYYNEHTDNEYLVLDELENTIKFASELLLNLHKPINEGLTKEAPFTNSIVGKPKSYSYQFEPTAYYDNANGVVSITDGQVTIDCLNEFEIDKLIQSLKRAKEMMEDDYYNWK